jgi:mRNA-degrading endonuclease YafQ of YafQ-DinJ toxin-antitoxin module
MKLAKTDFYAKKERKFFKKHPELIDKYGVILETLQINPFDATLKTHKLKGSLSDFYTPLFFLLLIFFFIFMSNFFYNFVKITFKFSILYNTKFVIFFIC